MSENKNGKGDRNRPKSVSYKKWSEHYEKIFRKKTIGLEILLKINNVPVETWHSSEDCIITTLDVKLVLLSSSSAI